MDPICPSLILLTEEDYNFLQLSVNPWNWAEIEWNCQTGELSAVLYSTVYYTVLYSTLLTQLYWTILCYFVLCYTLLYVTAVHYTVQNCQTGVSAVRGISRKHRQSDTDSQTVSLGASLTQTVWNSQSDTVSQTQTVSQLVWHSQSKKCRKAWYSSPSYRCNSPLFSNIGPNKILSVGKKFGRGKK